MSDFVSLLSSLQHGSSSILSGMHVPLLILSLTIPYNSGVYIMLLSLEMKLFDKFKSKLLNLEVATPPILFQTSNILFSNFFYMIYSKTTFVPYTGDLGGGCRCCFSNWMDSSCCSLHARNSPQCHPTHTRPHPPPTFKASANDVFLHWQPHSTLPIFLFSLYLSLST